MTLTGENKPARDFLKFVLSIAGTNQLQLRSTRYEEVRMWSFSSLTINRQKLVQIGVLGAILLLAFGLGTPNLSRTKMAPVLPQVARQQVTANLPIATNDKLEKFVASGVVGGVPGGAPQKRIGGIAEASEERKVIRTGALALIVLRPAEQVERIAQIAQAHGGYVSQSQVSGEREKEVGAITIRVPAAQFDAVRKELKGLAKSVDEESTTADDVTMRVAENEATLRNYRAEEASYIEIMKRSGKISDTLEVAQELADVRGRIERLAAEIRTMNLQSEMTAVTVSLRAEPVIVTGSEWRPLYELKLAWNDGLEALADYASAMMAFFLRLPAVGAWFVTLFVGLKLGLMILKKIGRSFGLWKPAPIAQ